jgi:hypothetical protein
MSNLERLICLFKRLRVLLIFRSSHRHPIIRLQVGHWKTGKFIPFHHTYVAASEYPLGHVGDFTRSKLQNYNYTVGGAHLSILDSRFKILYVECHLPT